jgi:hypothetical protein
VGGGGAFVEGDVEALHFNPIAVIADIITSEVDAKVASINMGPQNFVL